MDWPTVQKGIQDWVEGGGVTAIWADQGGPRPSTPYISMQPYQLVVHGQDWDKVEINEGGDPGEEVIHRVRGPRELFVRLTCFAAVAVGATMPLAILNTVKTRRRLPSVKSLLQTAGCGVARFSTAVAVPGIIGTKFEPRATMDVAIFLMEELTELGTLIETLEITNEIPEPDDEFVVTLP